MRAIQVHEPGGPDAMRVEDVPAPSPGPGEIAVDVQARGVNFIDVYQRSGAYPLPTPFTPGVEAAGVVAEVGDEVTDVAVGDRVGWVMIPGAYADRAVIPAARAIPIPDGVTSEDAAASMLQGMTAHYLTRSTYPVRAGDTVLVHAAAGGAGLMLVQFAKLAGARVIGTTSTESKAALAREAGADHVLGYEHFGPEVQEITDGAGVAAVYDGVGATTFDASLTSLRRRGVLAIFGQASGPVPPVDPQRLNKAGSVFLTRPTLAHYVETREELLQRSAELFALIQRGDLKVRVGGRYPLDEAPGAHRDLTERRTTGKLLLT
ncbi:quinone oxidoreductase [Spiractinospora alimapuensis]|uniref:quinone oxidoreductase family protein n=1 Tax=Spiractinospora alimapuensis TaxID=2820884 RepID=UPI001F29AC3F|nr:quinone oxidoreductase [Spiractinospora alimapuensis]QVQ51888.1 quinone oxidoreductase [Spiractinospora alimapuensis]